MSPGPCPTSRLGRSRPTEPGHQARWVWKASRRLTCGKPHFLVALGKLDIEIGDQGMDVVVALYLQAEGGCEGQLLRLHRVNVHLLQSRGERVRVIPWGDYRPQTPLGVTFLGTTCQAHPPPSPQPLPSFLGWSLLRACICACSVAQSCPTLCRPPGSSVHGILQARILE